MTSYSYEKLAEIVQNSQDKRLKDSFEVLVDRAQQAYSLYQQQKELISIIPRVTTALHCTADNLGNFTCSPNSNVISLTSLSVLKAYREYLFELRHQDHYKTPEHFVNVVRTFDYTESEEELRFELEPEDELDSFDRTVLSYIEEACKEVVALYPIIPESERRKMTPEQRKRIPRHTGQLINGLDNITAILDIYSQHKELTLLPKAYCFGRVYKEEWLGHLSKLMCEDSLIALEEIEKALDVLPLDKLSVKHRRKPSWTDYLQLDYYDKLKAQNKKLPTVIAYKPFLEEAYSRFTECQFVFSRVLDRIELSNKYTEFCQSGGRLHPELRESFFNNNF